MNDKDQEYAPLTDEEKETMKYGTLWRYVYPGVLLVMLFFTNVNSNLLLGCGMLVYAVWTYLFSQKPFLGFVLTMQKTRRETPHVPVDEAEWKRYRQDGLIISVLIAVLAAVFLIIWFVKR